MQNTQTNSTFRVVMKSSNTNSFGLFQMHLVNKEGVHLKSHASQYNAKESYEDVNVTLTYNKDGEPCNATIIGHEMTTIEGVAPKDVVKVIWP